MLDQQPVCGGWHGHRDSGIQCQTKTNPQPILFEQILAVVKRPGNQSIDGTSQEQQSGEGFGKQAECLCVFYENHDQDPADREEWDQQPEPQPRNRRHLPERQRPEGQPARDGNADVIDPMIILASQGEE